MEWRIISQNKDHRIESCEMPYGTWMISQSLWGRSDHIGRISFQPTLPEGQNYSSIMAAMRKLDEETGMTWCAAKDDLFKYMHPNEIGYAQNFSEALLLVEMLDQGSDQLPEIDAMLEASDFEFRHEFDNWRGHFKVYHHKTKKPLGLIISDEDIQATYDRSNGWENIFDLRGDYRVDHQTDYIKKTPYPPQVKYFKKVGLAFLIMILQLRIKRGGMFRKAMESIT
jgi:hypothetical protein